jgi:hypothetical protein
MKRTTGSLLCCWEATWKRCKRLRPSCRSCRWSLARQTRSRMHIPTYIIVKLLPWSQSHDFWFQRFIRLVSFKTSETIFDSENALCYSFRCKFLQRWRWTQGRKIGSWGQCFNYFRRFSPISAEKSLNGMVLILPKQLCVIWIKMAIFGFFFSNRKIYVEKVKVNGKWVYFGGFLSLCSKRQRTCLVCLYICTFAKSVFLIPM